MLPLSDGQPGASYFASLSLSIGLPWPFSVFCGVPEGIPVVRTWMGNQLAYFYLNRSATVHIYSFSLLLKAENLLALQDIKAYKQFSTFSQMKYPEYQINSRWPIA